MSEFRTAILFDSQAILKLLPEKAFVDCLTWDPSNWTVTIHWSHDGVRCPIRVSDWPLDLLKASKLPAGVTLAPGVTTKAFDKKAKSKEKHSV